MRSVAISMQTRIWQGRVAIKKLSWQEHVQAGNFPFRRDCRVCQEACAKDGHHRRSKLPARAGVLSMDVTGPFKQAPDLFRGSQAKYLLVATFTWPAKEAGEEKQEEECPPEAPQIEDLEAEEKEIQEEQEDQGGSPQVDEELRYMTGVHRPDLDVEPEPSILDEEGGFEEEE